MESDRENEALARLVEAVEKLAVRVDQIDEKLKRAEVHRGEISYPWTDMLDPFAPQDYSLRRNIEKILWDNTQNLHFAIRWMETCAAAEFVLKNIPLHRHFSPDQLRYNSLRQSGDGLYLEFGVAGGHWINCMADFRPDVIFHGFDSFGGLPGAWSLWPAQHYDLKGQLPAVRENVRLIKGLFQDTLDGFLEANLGPVAFVHLDCDLYDASKFVLERLCDRFVTGTQLVLDDYLTQPGWRDDQFKAVAEVFEERGVEFDYTGYTRIPPCTGVSIRIKSVRSR